MAHISKLVKPLRRARYLAFALIMLFAFQGAIEAQKTSEPQKSSDGGITFITESKYKEYSLVASKSGSAIGTTTYWADNPDGIPTVINAEFPEGKNALEKFVAEHAVYPEQINGSGLLGIIDVKFFVEQDGKLSEPRIANTLIIVPDDTKKIEGYVAETPVTVFQEAAINVVKQMPDWTPARLRDGKYVRTEIRLQMKFMP